MLKTNILIAFNSKKACLNILNVLNRYGISADYVCQSGANLRKMANYFGEGVIILGEKFKDELSANIINDFWQNFNIILIGTLDQINMYDDKKVYKLVAPLKQEEFILALEYQLYKHNPKKNVNTNDELIINKAKKILFEKYNFDEKKAYKYIQQLSMKKREKILNIAKKIIENKGEVL